MLIKHVATTMIKFTLRLPIYKIRIAVASKAGKRDKLLSFIEEVARVRAGSRISRAARLVANKSRIQKLLGAQLMGIALAANVIVPTNSVLANAQAPALTTLPAAETPILTTVVRRYPVEGKLIVTQGYHIFHPAIDIDGVTGDPIYPFMNGKVESAGREFFLGNAVRVEHAEGYRSVYAHLNKIEVKPGQEVTTKTELGEMGNTGRSTGDHLHLEVTKDGRSVNPITVMPKN